MTAAPDPQDSRIVYVNPAVSRVMGYSPQEAMGQKVSMFFGPEIDPAALERLRRVLILPRRRDLMRRPGRACSG